MARQQSEAADPAPSQLPSALTAIGDFVRQLQSKRPVLFLDYDGTLTPIVARPDLATLAPSVRSMLRELASRWTVSIVSGRDRADVQWLVGIDNLIYAGSHGFDIRGPDLCTEHGASFVADLDSIEQELQQTLAAFDGLLLERKRYSLAVHVRGLSPYAAIGVEGVVDAALTRRAGLRKGMGKKVFELLPRMDWNKGKAVLHILETLHPTGTGVLPIYIGDDRTDEDAFVALSGRGAGILVAQSPRKTAANYILRDPEEVKRFLRRLLDTVGPTPHLL